MQLVDLEVQFLDENFPGGILMPISIENLPQGD